MPWDLSCPDWVDRLRAGRSLVPDLPLDLAEGNRAVEILNRLRLADVYGQPTFAEAGGEWFRDIVRALFGSLDRATRRRMIRELFCLVPKKNSKTTNGACLMLTALLMNTRPNAPFILTAPVQDVTEIAFSQVKGAIELDPVLERTFHIREHVKTIVHRQTKAELQIMTFDPATLTGQKVVGLLIDELHVCAKMSRAASALRQLRGGMLPFPEAFLAIITTQSEDPPSGVFAAELKKARAIRDGKQVGVMLPVLYELPESMQKKQRGQVRADWEDPKHWPMITPNLGRSLELDRLIEECETARNTSEAELRAWASQHLNLEIGLALGSDAWVGARHWEKQGELGLTLEALIERCEVICIGIDGGGLDDLLAVAFLGRTVDGDWLHWGRAWCHQDVLELRKDIASKLLDFKEDGDLVITENVGDDVEELCELVRQVLDAGLLDKIGVDPEGIGAIVDGLVSVGVAIDDIKAISQGWRLVGAIKTTERNLAGGKIKHGGRRLMAWCLGNAKVEPRGNAVMITKQAAGVAKIDPLMALFDAVALMSMNPQAKALPGVVVL